MSEGTVALKGPERDLSEHLARIQEEIHGALRTHEIHINNSAVNGRTRFGEVSDLVVTPDKGYTARATCPVLQNDNHVGDLTVVVFDYQDGTGSTIDYSLEDVDIKVLSEDIKRGLNPEVAMPRNKTGTLFEVALPLLSYNGERFFFNAVSLTQRGLSIPQPPFDKFPEIKPKVTEEHPLGMWNNLYAIQVCLDKGTGNKEFKPKALATVGSNIAGERFGDPHAFVMDGDLGTLQVVGFYAIKAPPEGEPMNHFVADAVSDLIATADPLYRVRGNL